MHQTHFGYKHVPETAKAGLVRGVFDSVAARYDVMNDVMSLGMHRLWKRYATLVADVQPGMRVLDIAAGTGDLTGEFARKVTATGLVVHTDINAAMLQKGRKRLVNSGVTVPSLQCDAEHLPFASASFDRVSVAFGLRNMTHKERALAEMLRVLKPEGRLLVLEFSKVAAPLQKAYDWYSFSVLPRLGHMIAGDAQSYQYLAESIRMHPDQAALQSMMLAQGFAHVDVHNLSAGVVALHVGIKGKHSASKGL